MSSALDMLVGGPNTATSNISPIKPITDQSDHVSGGMPGSGGTNAVAPDYAKSVLYWCAAIVLGALALLWITGGFTLRSALR